MEETVEKTMGKNYYTDTRGRSEQAVPFTEAIIKGLAKGGGLFVPEKIPRLALEEILALAEIPYAQQAAFIYKKFAVNLPDVLIDELMTQAYGSNFNDKAICPIVSLDSSTHLLELWHGPTGAFKDMALQCLPLFFTACADVLRKEGSIDHDFMILVATSGDTGTAALQGFRDKPGVRIGVLYPHGGVSDIQYKQMATQAGENVMVWGVRGNFDDCQNAAKAVFDDSAYNSRLESEAHVALSSANSINWGRLLPQIVYYVSSYAVLVKQEKLAPGQALDVCVPTGNFGNILAAWYAKQMGTPLKRLLCASNENRVLTDFINTGTYDISNRKFLLTPSPSMDILVSSNLERQLFELTGRNAQNIRKWMDDLRTNKCFCVDDETFAHLRDHFVSESVDSKTCLETIKQVYESYDYLLDPHTAVAYKVAEQLRGNNPLLIASTAHWAKFGENVYRALHEIDPGQDLPDEIARLTGCELNEHISQQANSAIHRIPESLAILDKLPLRFEGIIGSGSNEIMDAIDSFVGWTHRASATGRERLKS